MVSENGSVNAEVASRKETECLSRFAAAFSGPHSKLIIVVNECAIALRHNGRLRDYFVVVRPPYTSCAQSCACAILYAMSETGSYIEFFAIRAGSHNLLAILGLP